MRNEQDWGLNVGYGLGEKFIAVGGGGGNVGYGEGWLDEGIYY